MYKFIMNRLKGIFLEVIGSAQAVFVLGRKIFDFILWTQELMHNYHLACWHNQRVDVLSQVQEFQSNK